MPLCKILLARYQFPSTGHNWPVIVMLISPVKAPTNHTLGKQEDKWGSDSRNIKKTQKKLLTGNCANRKESSSEFHKLALTDHVAQENHVIDWEGAKIIDRDSNKLMFTRKIRKRGPKSINQGEGLLSIDHIYNPLHKMTATSSPRNHNKFRRKCSGSDHL